MSRDRAEERATARKAVIAALLPLLVEDQHVVLDDVQYALKQTQERVRTPTKGPSDPAPPQTVDAATVRGGRTKRALLALAKHRGGALSKVWLCEQIYGTDTTEHRQALAMLFVNMRKKGLIDRTQLGIKLTALGQAAAQTLEKGGR